jgi:hypothetical protein
MRNQIQKEINQMYRQLRKRGLLVDSRLEDDGAIREVWWRMEHKYIVTKDPGCNPHMLHSCSTDTTFVSE